MLDVKKLTNEEANVLLLGLSSINYDRTENRQVAGELYTILIKEVNARCDTQNNEQPAAETETEKTTIQSEETQMNSIYNITYEINRIIKRIINECEISIPVFKSLYTPYEDAQGRIRLTLPEGCTLKADIEIPLAKNIKNSENISLTNAMDLASKTELDMLLGNSTESRTACVLGKGKTNSKFCILQSVTIKTRDENNEVDG